MDSLVGGIILIAVAAFGHFSACAKLDRFVDGAFDGCFLRASTENRLSKKGYGIASVSYDELLPVAAGWR